MTPERFALNMIKVVDCSGLGPHSQSTFAQNNKTCGENGEQKISMKIIIGYILKM